MAGRADIRQSKILQGNNLPLLKKIAAESVALIYIDPPFNTGKTQSRIRIKTAAVSAGKNAAAGDRNGFGGRRYATTVIGRSGYEDSFADYPGFLRPRLQEAHRILAPNGSLFFHIDWRESARCRLLLEEIFGGPEHCINEIIWAYDFGARSKKKWPAKHDNIYWFAKDPANYIFNFEAIDRIPYMAPGLAGAEKAARGKTPTDTWWQTIVPTNGREKTGYATQKPLRILERIVRVHSNPGDVVLDFFAGSGTTGEAAIKNDRRFVLMDSNADAVRMAKERLASRDAAARQARAMHSAA
ncbi:MAG: site-specific DNA-methyltransferase [Gammaproteobacteria bacterium]|nr:site-specific DNA-methyltransferase [Gammaproteobacteria bacterium]